MSMLMGKSRDDVVKHETALVLAKWLLGQDPVFDIETADEYYDSLRRNEIETFTYLYNKHYNYYPMQEKWSKGYDRRSI